MNKIWSSKKYGEPINDIHSLCGKITDAIIKYSMEKNSVDNVSVIFNERSLFRIQTKNKMH